MSEESERKKFFQQQEMITVLLNPHLGDINQYFIESEVTNNEIYSDLQFNINHAFIVAARNGSLAKIKYFLTSPDLNIHADIHFHNNAAMDEACSRGYQHITQYLLYSSDLKEHAKVPEDMDWIIEALIQETKDAKTIDEQFDYLQFINYLINDLQIRPTENIINTLRKETHHTMYKPAIKQLEQNELFHSLQDELKNNKNTSNKKVKI